MRDTTRPPATTAALFAIAFPLLKITNRPQPSRFLNQQATGGGKNSIREYLKISGLASDKIVNPIFSENFANHPDASVPHDRNLGSGKKLY
jgi:hypothetical protein